MFDDRLLRSKDMLSDSVGLLPFSGAVGQGKFVGRVKSKRKQQGERKK